jgi:uridylate kinase
MKYKRVLLKLSGEMLGGDKNFGIDTEALNYFTSEIKTVLDEGVQLGLVIGGGNIFRGAELLSDQLTDKLTGDYMGMLATVINGMAMQSAFIKMGITSRLITSFRIDKVGEIYNQQKVLKYLQEGNLVIFAGGTGNPYFTTDTAAALRAVEIKADLLVKGTKVDGVFTADPVKDKSAVKFDVISYNEILDQELGVMDMTAITLCKENAMPLIVLDINKKSNLYKALKGEAVGTTVH